MSSKTKLFSFWLPKDAEASIVDASTAAFRESSDKRLYLFQNGELAFSYYNHDDFVTELLGRIYPCEKSFHKFQYESIMPSSRAREYFSTANEGGYSKHVLLIDAKLYVNNIHIADWNHSPHLLEGFQTNKGKTHDLIRIPETDQFVSLFDDPSFRENVHDADTLLYNSSIPVFTLSKAGMLYPSIIFKFGHEINQYSPSVKGAYSTYHRNHPSIQSVGCYRSIRVELDLYAGDNYIGRVSHPHVKNS